MNKLEVSQRVLKDGKSLDLELFTWDEGTSTFSSEVKGLVFDFNNIGDCTFTTRSDCVFKTGSYCTFKTGSYCTFTTGWYCTFKTGSDCTFKTGSDCTFTSGFYCTFYTGSYCTFTTGWRCTFTTNYDCTFFTCNDCTFTTGSDCVFKTGSDCVFKTGSYCTFSIGDDCTFTTGSSCVILRSDTKEVIQSIENIELRLAPHSIFGYVSNNIYSETNKPAIIADEILSHIKSTKKVGTTTIYTVINHNEHKETFLIERDGVYSHGDTVQNAIDSLRYKIKDRDTTKYSDVTSETIMTTDEAITFYRTITGACESGTKYFIDSLTDVPNQLSIKELIELTKMQYGNSELVKFINKN